MAVNYATSNFIMEEHTGAAVPLFSNEEGVGIIPHSCSNHKYSR